MVSVPALAAPPIWILAGLAGCYNPPALEEGAPCQRSEQCPEPQQCVFGHCSLHAGSPAPDGQPAPPPDARTPSDARIDAMPVPCIADGLSCGNATPVAFMCGTQCWVKCSSTVTRAAAQTACTGWTGALGEIDDPTEQGCVAGMIVNATFWLGAIQGAGAAMPGDRWTWNGDATRPWTYDGWSAGKPDDAGDNVENGEEQCGTIRPGGGWDDDSCNQLLGFFCRRPTLR